MHRGDTGSFTLRVTGHTFGADDRMLFTVRDRTKTIVIQRVYEMTDNAAEVEFANADTDYLPAGEYQWDARYIENPQYDTNDEIVDGDGVSTPGSPYQLHLLDTVGQV